MTEGASGGSRHETDTVIARMEAELKRDRSPFADTETEARAIWHHGPLAGVPGGFVHAVDASLEAVDMPDITVWISHKAGAKATRHDQLLGRWLQSRARQRDAGATSALAEASSRASRAVREYAKLVPSESRDRFAVDVKYVLERLALVFAGNQGLIWLESYNYNLDARPIDVLRERGPAEVIAAIDGEEQGAL